MRTVWAALRKDLLRQSRDIVALALWQGFPLFVLALLLFVFGRQGTSVQPQGILLISDQDQTLVSRAVPLLFGQGPLAKTFRTEAVGEDAGMARMGRGEGTALIVVPPGFQNAILRNQPVTLRLVTNPSQRILPLITRETLTVAADGVRFLHLVAGSDLDELAATIDNPAEQSVLAASARLYRLVTALRPFFEPLLLEAEIQEVRRVAPASRNMTVGFFTGMLLLSVLFLARGMSGDFWEEHRLGTLARTQASGQPLVAVLLGKLLCVVLLGTTAAALVMLAGRTIVDLPMAQPVAVIAWIAGAAAVLWLGLSCLQLAAASPQGGDLLTSLVVFPSAMLGGSFFPFAMMPDSLAAIGRRTPYGWLVDRFLGLLAGSLSLTEVLISFAVLGVAAALLLALAAWSVRYRFLKG